MRWFAWLRRRSELRETEMPATTVPLVTPSDETRRAETAAREAAAHLHETRARRPEVRAQAHEIERVNRENGFARLIREALGRNA
jgi:hypothetical protein